jgi:putative peptide zinc metalloprotease protein
MSFGQEQPVEAKEPKQNKSQIKLRPDLELTYLNDGTLQIRDPKEVRFFHLGFDETEIIKMLEKMHPLEIIHRSSYTEQELRQFLGMLKQWGLLEGTAPPPRQSTKQKTVLQFMFQRFKLVDPDKLLEDLVPKLSWMWSTPAKIFGIIITILAIYQAFASGMSFATYGWPLIADSWAISLIAFILLLTAVLSGHEMAHGLCLKRFGGTVPEMGFYFVYMTPALYTDVSDVYKLPTVGQKIWVMLAGPLFQAVVGCIAFLLWAAAVPHTAVADLLYLLVVASFFSLSINLNPLIRLDGYYVLQLALNIYALRRRAWSYIRSLLLREPFEEKLTPRERKIFLLYAPLSVIYTFFIMMIVMSFYFGSSFLNFPAITATIAILLFLASRTPLPPQSGLEEMDASPTQSSNANNQQPQ